MVGHFSANDVPSLLKAQPNINFPPLLADLFFIHSTHFVQIFATFATIWQSQSGHTSQIHPHLPTQADPMPILHPLELQLKASFSPNHSMIISINTTAKYFFRYAKCISVALQMGKGVMRRKWGNRGSLQSTLLISTQITVRHCWYSSCTDSVQPLQCKGTLTHFDSFILQNAVKGATVKGVAVKGVTEVGSTTFPPSSYQHTSLSCTAFIVAAEQRKCNTQRLDSIILCI